MRVDTVKDMELRNARVLVVGASGVLGGAIADRLHAAGASVVVAGRDPQRLGAVAERVEAVASLELDLVDVEACAALVQQAASALGGLTGIVVASGVAAFGPAREEDDVVVEELFAVNTLGPIALVRASLEHLGEGGAIAVISAVLADVPTAGMASYSASKAATSAYLTALRREVRRDKITVFDARPPHMETGLADRALAGTPPRMPQGHDVDEVVALIVQGIAEGKSELVANLKAGTVSLT